MPTYLGVNEARIGARTQVSAARLGPEPNVLSPSLPHRPPARPGWRRIHPYADRLVLPLKQALDTREPVTVAVTLQLMNRIVAADPAVAVEWVPHFWQFAQVLRLFRSKAAYKVGAAHVGAGSGARAAIPPCARVRAIVIPHYWLAHTCAPVRCGLHGARRLMPVRCAAPAAEAAPPPSTCAGHGRPAHLHTSPLAHPRACPSSPCPCLSRRCHDDRCRVT